MSRPGMRRRTRWVIWMAAGPVTRQVLAFMARTGTHALALRSDIYYKLCDELVGGNEWVGELNGCLIFLGTRSEGRTTPLPVQRCRRFRGLG